MLKISTERLLFLFIKKVMSNNQPDAGTTGTGQAKTEPPKQDSD
jgi:hypothetical protein